MSENLNAKIHVLLGGEEQITSPFGKRKDPVTGKASTHNGVDLIGAGMTILCASDGVVQNGEDGAWLAELVKLDKTSDPSVLAAKILERAAEINTRTDDASAAVIRIKAA